MNKSSVIALFLLMAGVMNAQDNNNTRIKFVEGFWDHQVNGIFYKEVTREDGMKAVEVALPQVWYLNPDGSYVNIWSSEYPYMQTEITIPESITVGDGVTGQATTYPVIGIGDYAFRGASNLARLTLPNTITYVGNEAFEGTDTLRTFTIPHSVRSVGSLAFARSGIEEIHVPYNANEWLDSYSAFQSCEKLRKVTFSDTLVAIQNRMFWGCTALEEVYIPDGVKYIGEGAFSACQNLAEIHLPAMLDTLRNRTFHSCPLRKLEIPAGVQYVEPSALLGTYLMNLTVDPGNGRYDSRDNCNAIVRTRDNTIVAACNGSFIPESVDSIGWEAFVELDGIRSITFPKHLKHIASEGLFNLWNLTLVTSYIDKPAGVLENGAISGWDENVLDNITLYVPAGTLAAYKADSEWAKFKHIIEMSGENKPATVEDLTPVEQTGQASFENVPAGTDITNAVIENMYVTCDTTDNHDRYDATEKAFVFETVVDSLMMNNVLANVGNMDIIRNNFSGIILEIPAGEGTVKITIKTLGNRKVAVQIEGLDPVLFAQVAKGEISVPYNILQSAYVYIYPVMDESAASPAPKKVNNIHKAAQAESNLVHIYGAAWEVKKVISDVEETSTVNPQSSIRKFIRDGQLYIMHNGVLYNANGAVVR